MAEAFISPTSRLTSITWMLLDVIERDALAREEHPVRRGEAQHRALLHFIPVLRLVDHRAVGVERLEDLLFVGDDLANDMGGAKAVGLTTAWLAPGRARPPHPAIDHHLTKLTELLAVVAAPPPAPSRG